MGRTSRSNRCCCCFSLSMQELIHVVVENNLCRLVEVILIGGDRLAIFRHQSMIQSRQKFPRCFAAAMKIASQCL